MAGDRQDLQLLWSLSGVRKLYVDRTLGCDVISAAPILERELVRPPHKTNHHPKPVGNQLTFFSTGRNLTRSGEVGEIERGLPVGRSDASSGSSGFRAWSPSLMD